MAVLVLVLVAGGAGAGGWWRSEMVTRKMNMDRLLHDTLALVLEF